MKQMKMKTQHSKLMGCSKSKTKWQDYSDTYWYLYSLKIRILIIPQKIRKSPKLE